MSFVELSVVSLLLRDLQARMENATGVLTGWQLPLTQKYNYYLWYLFPGRLIRLPCLFCLSLLFV
jgi:hypothetical protein